MTSPIQGGGGPTHDNKAESTPSPKPFTEDTEGSEKTKVNPQLHPIAEWFINTWHWTPKQALSAEKQYLKNIMEQCQHLMDKYKNIYKKLNPENPDNQ